MGPASRDCCVGTRLALHICRKSITAFKGCSVDISDYIVYNPSTIKLVTPRHARFDETFDGRIGEEGQKTDENTNLAEIQLNNTKSLYGIKQKPRTWTQPTNFEYTKPADLYILPPFRRRF